MREEIAYHYARNRIGTLSLARKQIPRGLPITYGRFFILGLPATAHRK